MSMNLILEIILIAVIALLALYFIIWEIKKNGLRKVVIDLIVEAESTLDDNQEKFNQVVTGIINKLPFPFNMIPTRFVSNFVQKVFDEVKIALDYQKDVENNE